MSFAIQNIILDLTINTKSAPFTSARRAMFMRKVPLWSPKPKDGLKSPTLKWLYLSQTLPASVKTATCRYYLARAKGLLKETGLSPSD